MGATTYLALKAITGYQVYIKVENHLQNLVIHGLGGLYAKISHNDKVFNEEHDWDLLKLLLLDECDKYDLSPKQSGEDVIISIKTKEDVPVTIGKFKLVKEGESQIPIEEFLEAFAGQRNSMRGENARIRQELEKAQEQLEAMTRRNEQTKKDYEYILRDTEEKFYQLLNSKKDRIRELTWDEPVGLNGDFSTKRRKVKVEETKDELQPSDSFQVARNPSIELTADLESPRDLGNSDIDLDEVKVKEEPDMELKKESQTDNDTQVSESNQEEETQVEDEDEETQVEDEDEDRVIVDIEDDPVKKEDINEGKLGEKEFGSRKNELGKQELEQLTRKLKRGSHNEDKDNSSSNAAQSDDISSGAETVYSDDD